MSDVRSLWVNFPEDGRIDLQPQPKSKSVEGTYNSVQFFQTDDMSSTLVKLAHSQNKESEDKESAAVVSKVQTLLVENGVNRRYIQNFLYYDTMGIKVSFHASEGSLHHFINAQIGQLTRDEIKDIFGQILLGVRALHEKNLVHRDIKAANILITKDVQGRWFVQICDLDSVAKVNQDGTISDKVDFVMNGGTHCSPELAVLLPTGCDLYLGELKDNSEKLSRSMLKEAEKLKVPLFVRVKATQEYVMYSQPKNQPWGWTLIDDLTPEAKAFFDGLVFANRQIPAGHELFSNPYLYSTLKKCHVIPAEKAWVDDTPESREIYKKINLKADDCFALSVILSELLEAAAPGEITQNDVINDLAFKLRRTLPSQRSTIEGALTHEFFGAREEKSENTFIYKSFCVPDYEVDHVNYDPTSQLILNNFFQELLGRESPFEFIGKYRAEVLKLDDCSFLVKEDLREAYCLAESLINQLDYFEYISKTDLNEKTLDILVRTLEVSQVSLRKTIDNLQDELTIALKNYPVLSPVRELLMGLQSQVEKEWSGIFSSIDMRLIKRVVEAIKRNDDATVALHWQKINPITVKNCLAKFLDDGRLLDILQQQPNHQKEFKDVIKLLELTIANVADARVASIAQNVLENIRKPNQIGVADKDIPLLTELAHRMIIGLNDPAHANNAARLVEISKLIPKCSVILGMSLTQVIIHGVYEAKRSGLSASWIFACAPERSRADSEEKQAPTLSNNLV